MSRPADASIILGPGEGRAYAMGAISAVFLADEAETDAAYSISEWRLEPHSDGPGKHAHEAHDDMFYVLEGVMSFWVGDAWIKAPAGSFVRVGKGVAHDFRNEGDSPARMLNIYIPGGFERDMPAIVDWFAKQR
ncbi:MAG: cupin domain-containing protein [Terricaulis sp.]|nr:cupin domain-containing protein [Terricaulis sp.]